MTIETHAEKLAAALTEAPCRESKTSLLKRAVRLSAVYGHPYLRLMELVSDQLQAAECERGGAS